MKILSYPLALFMCGLALWPPFSLSIPVMVNSYQWLFYILIAAMLGFYSISLKIPLSLKALMLYLFANCFISQIPYLGFNAYIVQVFCFYFFVACIYADKKVIINMVSAVFWVEVILLTMQLTGHDRLMNMGRPQPVFFGTVFQYMRFSSLLAMLAPFLILKSRWYIVPLAVLAVMSGSFGFAFGIAAGIFTYSLLAFKKHRKKIILVSLVCLAFMCYWERESLYAEYKWGRLPAWIDITKSWVANTAGPDGWQRGGHWGAHIEGPFSLTTTLFGHGADTFLPLFPIYKHDPNPFPDAHNDFLQILWEIGLLGLGILVVFMLSMIRKLYRRKEYILLSGLAIMFGNMFFAMPMRQVYTILLMVGYLGICQGRIKDAQGI